MNQSTAEKQETKAENQTSGNSDAPPENRKRALLARFWREVKDSVLELGIFAVGGALIWTGLSADPRFLQKFFFYLDVQSWTTLTKISFVITVLFVIGWIRIFFGFLTKSIDEYGEALSGRYLRMSFFTSASLWTAAYIFSPGVWRPFWHGCIKLFGFGQLSASSIFVMVALVALVSATAYFLFRWFALKFFDMY